MKPLDEALREAARALRDEYTGGCACDYPQCDCYYDCERDDRTVEVLRDPLLAALRALDEAGYVLVPKTVTPSTAAAVLGLSEIESFLPNMKQAAMNRGQERLDALLAAAPKPCGAGPNDGGET